jgi:hypothetical protein
MSWLWKTFVGQRYQGVGWVEKGDVPSVWGSDSFESNMCLVSRVFFIPRNDACEENTEKYGYASPLCPREDTRILRSERFLVPFVR